MERTTRRLATSQWDTSSKRAAHRFGANELAPKSGYVAEARRHRRLD